MKYIIRFKAQQKPKKTLTMEEKRVLEREALFQMYSQHIDFKDESQHHRFFFEFSGGYRNDLRKQYFAAQGQKCGLCKGLMVLDGVKDKRNREPHNLASWDHIIPIIHGGTHEKDNLHLACRSCNTRKSDKPIDQWNVPSSAARSRTQKYIDQVAFITPEIKAQAVEILKQSTDGRIPDDAHIQLLGDKEHSRKNWKLVVRALVKDGVVEITRRGTGTLYAKDHPDYLCTLIKVNECIEESKSTTPILINT